MWPITVCSGHSKIQSSNSAGIQKLIIRVQSALGDLALERGEVFYSRE